MNDEVVAPKAKKAKTQKLDAEGNPIVKAPKEPKLDAEGNPIVKAPRAPAVPVDPTNVIILLTAKDDAGAFKNPKRENTEAWNMFSLYRDGMTVKEYVEAGGSVAYVRWDLGKGHISLG